MCPQDKTPTHSATHSTDSDDQIIGVAFRASLLVILTVIVIASLAWWYLQPQPETPDIKSTPILLPHRREIPNVRIPNVPFLDITAEAGIDFVHENGAAGEKLLPETMGGGCGFLDIDHDGDQDIILVNGSQWPWDTNTGSKSSLVNIYLNDGTGRFKNTTEGSGLDVSGYGTGLACADIDGDGHTDLFISCVGPDRLYRNLGNLQFEDITEKAGVSGPQDTWSTSCGFIDINNDDDLDLFVCSYVEWSRDSDRSQDFRLVGGERAYGRPQNFAGTFARLYLNNGSGTFTDISQPAGIQIRNPATNNPLAKSLGVTFEDFDDDGWMDIIVANDTVQNFLFHNKQDGTFEEIGGLAGVAFDIEGKARGAMGIDVSHFRNDRDIGILIGNFANEMTALYVSGGEQLQFRDDAILNGLGPPTRLELTFGVAFVDIDLDGRLDVISANGHLEEDINRVQKTQTYQQPPRLYWNCGIEHTTEFLPVPASHTGEDFARPMVGRSLAIADIDNDGDVDVLLTASGGSPRLLRNDQHTGHHWIRLKLSDNSNNQGAIGAKVVLTREKKDGSMEVQTRRVNPTRGYQSQSELPVTFGLGENKDTGTITIYWQNGDVSTHTQLIADHVHVIQRENALDTSASD